jgi:hypothetical protein
LISFLPRFFFNISQNLHTINFFRICRTYHKEPITSHD